MVVTCVFVCWKRPNWKLTNYLDFSTAYYSIRHSTLFDKLVRLYIPDHVYNWLVYYFQGYSNCTKYENNTSAFADISASIIQRPAIAPASYVVHASDLVSVIAGNSLCDYADDTYVIIPASNHLSRCDELDNIETWANHNNLHLNGAKCVKTVFSQTMHRCTIHPTAPLPDITGVSTIKILGVTVSNKLSVSDHISYVIRSCAHSLHAPCTLWHQCMD